MLLWRGSQSPHLFCSRSCTFSHASTSARRSSGRGSPGPHSLPSWVDGYIGAPSTGMDSRCPVNSQLVLQLLTPLIVASASLLVFFLARWPTRDHWAGSLLVDLSDVRSRRAARIQGGVIGISGSLGLAFSALSYYSGQLAHLPAYQLVLPLSLGLGARVHLCATGTRRDA